MDKENKLGLDDDDLENIGIVVNDLIDCVTKFTGFDEPKADDYVNLLHTLDYAKFIVSGIMYSNGMDVCTGHDDDE